MTNTYAVIMAGGSGTRFWPRSRARWPKQFLAIGDGERSLLQRTVDRIAPLIPPDRIYIVTNAQHVEATRQQLPEVPADQILGEPVGRNTAPCIAWGAAVVRRRDPEALLAVLPADPHIGDESRYLAVLRQALADAGSGALVTIGIQPSRPETGYGYLELGEALGPASFRCARFVEKPDRDTAEQYLRSGRFLWNSGMFFFQVGAIVDAVRKHLPELAAAIDELDRAAAAGNEAERVAALYPRMPSISIDHGVMERAERIVVVPGEFGWDDVGHWASAWSLSSKDDSDNAAPQSAVLVDSKRCYVQGPGGKVIALVGVEDLIVVDTEDALLVMPRERAQDVRNVIAELKRRNDTEHL